jgi:hypothetical protein
MADMVVFRGKIYCTFQALVALLGVIVVVFASTTWLIHCWTRALFI